MSTPGSDAFSTITKQPTNTSDTVPGDTVLNGVSVRTLRNTPEEAEFAARLIVEAFRGKFVHNITEAKLQIAVRHMTAFHLGQADDFRERTFVAELDRSPVGLIGLKFHGDKERDVSDHVSELGCWHALRYACLGMVTETSVPRGTCYVDHIGVDDRARGMGVGKVLMERAEYEARRRQCKSMYLYVTTTNRARHLYERQGYAVTETSSMCGCLGCCIGPPGSVYKMVKPL